MFQVIYKGELYQVFDMNDRHYIARNSKGKQVFIQKDLCEVV